ncbi:MAG TPA: hydantoinase/oxoprolinase family protein [Solirubrobacterales bacterium]|nr:hydantoinase/oxoprolinase family protein [Solirubrobacterales bacterium]
MEMSSGAMLGVDVGGTFTDVVAVRDGVIETTKVPTDLVDTARGVLAGARQLRVGEATVFNHASTAGLNALLTRRIPKVGLLCTAGHRDILDIGQNWRPADAVTDPRWRRSFGDSMAPLVPRYLRRGVRERVGADGGVVVELDEEQAREQIRVLGRCDVEGVAICLLNAYVSGAHEERLHDLVREELGEAIPVAVSSRVSPLAREYQRTSTTVIDAIMGITYGEYSKRLDAGLRELGFEGRWNYADCAAMLAPVETAMARPSRVIFSGPAAGTSASAHFGELIGDRDLLCVDVGGTSTDVSVVVGGRPIVNNTVELEHDMLVSTLSNEITSVGAGGGSIVWVGDSGEIQVGPKSAGAEPGPACYARGGTEPTMTDACLLIGILDEERFLGGEGRLDRSLALEAFESLDTPLDLSERVFNAFNIGLNNIAEGIVDIVIRNGIDPREFSLVAYGAAGPMLLPALIGLIGARRAIVPPHPGLFSALGLLSADMVFMESRSRYLPLAPDSAAEIRAIYEELQEAVEAQVGGDSGAAISRSFDARMAGQAYETPFIDAPDGEIDEGAIATMVTTFHDVYEQRAGNRFAEVPLQGVTFRVQATVPTPKAAFAELDRGDGDGPPVSREVTIEHLQGAPYAAAEYQREQLRAGDRLSGPAIVREALSTTFVPPGQELGVGAYGELIVTEEEK